MVSGWVVVAAFFFGCSAGAILVERIKRREMREDIARAIESVVGDWPDFYEGGHSPASDGQWIADFVRDGDIWG